MTVSQSPLPLFHTPVTPFVTPLIIVVFNDDGANNIILQKMRNIFTDINHRKIIQLHPTYVIISTYTLYYTIYSLTWSPKSIQTEIESLSSLMFEVDNTVLD